MRVGSATRVSLALVDVDTDQCRSAFDPDALEGLARSLKEVGLLHPIIVRRQGERYQIIAGERRFRAARLLGWDTIEAIVLPPGTEANDPRVQLIENLQREDLNPVDKALAVRRFMLANRLNKVQVAEALGIPRTTISDWLNLLEVSPTFQRAVISHFQRGESALTPSHVSIALGVERKLMWPGLAERLLGLAESHHLSKAELRRVAQLLQERRELSPEEAALKVRAETERRRRAAEREKESRALAAVPVHTPEGSKTTLVQHLCDSIERLRTLLAEISRVVPPGGFGNPELAAAASPGPGVATGERGDWQRAADQLVNLYEVLTRVLQDVFGVDAVKTADRRYLERRRAERRFRRVARGVGEIKRPGGTAPSAPPGQAAASGG